MVKHTQAIRQQFAKKLSVFDHFVGVALKGLIKVLSVKNYLVSINF